MLNNSVVTWLVSPCITLMNNVWVVKENNRPIDVCLLADERMSEEGAAWISQHPELNDEAHQYLSEFKWIQKAPNFLMLNYIWLRIRNQGDKQELLPVGMVYWYELIYLSWSLLALVIVFHHERKHLLDVKQENILLEHLLFWQLK